MVQDRLPLMKTSMIFIALQGSDILYLGVLGKHIVVLISIDASNELCAERSSIY
jgi:hypothetical protein